MPAWTWRQKTLNALLRLLSGIVRERGPAGSPPVRVCKRPKMCNSIYMWSYDGDGSFCQKRCSCLRCKCVQPLFIFLRFPCRSRRRAARTVQRSRLVQAHLQQKRQKQAWLEGAQTSSGGLVMPAPHDSGEAAERIPPRLVRTLTQDAAEGAGDTSGGKPRGTS